MERNRVQRVKSTARLIPLGFFFVTLFFVLGFPRLAQVSRANPDPKSTVKPDIEEIKKAVVREDYGKLPLSFIQNEGQVDKQVKFYEKGSGRATFFTKDSLYLSLIDSQNASTTDNAQSALIKLMLLGANKHPKIVAEGVQEGKVNYFIGNDPKKWKTNLPTYRAVVYKDLYPDIDMKFYGNNLQLEYDIIVKPGADPAMVKFAYEGIKGLRVTEDGNLEIRMQEGTILQKKPFVYQEMDGKRVKLDGKFKILERKDHSIAVHFPISDTIGHEEDKARVVTFVYAIEVPQYDKNYPLIIDPVLVYSTYLGGSNSDSGVGIAVDASGNAYVTGYTSSTNLPTASPFQAAYAGGTDAFVTKLNAAGSALVYSTYLGGGGLDNGFGIAVDGSGNAYVTGFTNSTNFPTASPFQAVFGGGVFDAFVTKLDAAGSALVYSTYLGGSNGDSSSGIAVDSSGNAYVTGNTASSNFPMASPFQATYGGISDAFVTKLNAAGSALVYSTYLGGSSNESGRDIAVDGLGNAYVSGWTNSTNFPTASPFQAVFGGGGGGDAFVTKLDAAGSALVYSTYLGGSNDDNGFGIAVDTSGNAYVTGFTKSTNFPTANPFQAVLAGGPDAFVTKLNAAGSALVYSTYLGGSNDDYGFGIAVDTSGNAHVAGITISTNFPTANPFQAVFGGGPNGDAFVTKLNAAGSALVYSTYLGGSNDESDYGNGIAVDASGNAYVTGYTSSTNFPTASPFQAANAGGIDAFVAKISAEIITTTTTTTISTPTTTTTTTTTTTSTTTTTTCNDQNKDKGKGHNKGRCKGHDK